MYKNESIEMLMDSKLAIITDIGRMRRSKLFSVKNIGTHIKYDII